MRIRLFLLLTVALLLSNLSAESKGLFHLVIKDYVDY